MQISLILRNMWTSRGMTGMTDPGTSTSIVILKYKGEIEGRVRLWYLTTILASATVHDPQ